VFGGAKVELLLNKSFRNRHCLYQQFFFDETRGGREKALCARNRFVLRIDSVHALHRCLPLHAVHFKGKLNRKDEDYVVNIEDLYEFVRTNGPRNAKLTWQRKFEGVDWLADSPHPRLRLCAVFDGTMV
jgi:hypothetical protein